MQAQRTVFGRLAQALAFAALLGSCGGSAAPVPAFALEASAESFRDDAPRELGADDTCDWLDDGRLFVETVSEYGGIQSVNRLWIRFQPPELPQVELASWKGDVTWGTRWPHTQVQGRAWVSSNGIGLGEPGGPVLTIDTESIFWISGSDSRSGGRLLLRAHALARED